MEKETFFDSDLLDAYLEMCLGTLALRLPEIQAILCSEKYRKNAAVKSSYSHTKEDMIINIAKVIKDIANEGLKGSKKLRSAFTQVNRIFLISMWDILLGTKTYSMIYNNEDVQFLRHIRNGCAHHNKFKLDKKTSEELSTKPAKWRNKNISASLNGTPVIPNFLMDGDVPLLLYDINKKYFINCLAP